MKCLACMRVAVTDLCEHHQSAKDRVLAAYKGWQDAYGTIEWKEYLHRVKQADQTGQWAKEIAEILEGV